MGHRLFEFFPNFTLLFWAPGWYLTYHYWPTAVDNAHLRGATLYFVPPTNTRQRLCAGAGGGDVQGVRVPGRQHAGSHPDDDQHAGSVTDFPLCDQEILLRHLHKTAGDYVNRVQEAMDVQWQARADGRRMPQC